MVLPGAGLKPSRVQEAVFSSTGFRIRAAEPAAATARVARWAEHVVASVFFAFFPADCCICGSPLLQISRLPVCNDCLGSLRPLAGSFCAVCGEDLGFADLDFAVAPYSAGHGEASLQGSVRCRVCELAPPPFERAVAYGSYDGALRDLVHLLKFDQVRPAAQVLGRMLADTMTALDPTLPAGRIAVVPVPLHKHKKSQRGFNQAELIVRTALKKISRQSRIANRAGRRFELCADTLVRLRDTGSQIGLTRPQRRENLRGAFVVKNGAAISNRNVLLVDDVYTTGATASECARVLRRAGAERVWVATVGRTLRVTNFSVQPADSFAVRDDEPGITENGRKQTIGLAAHGG